MSLFEELKRRNVLRVAAAYVAVAWLLIQVVETLFPVFGLSDGAIRAVVIALAIGFVPAAVSAWAFELTPQGLIRDSEVDRGSAAVRANTKRLDRIVMVALALAVGYFAFDKFMLDPARDQAREQAIAEIAREQGRTEAAQASRDDGPPVLAVLPFAAVTDTEDSVFFAAGVHDDLLTKMAQLPSMLVISRTSVLEYKDTQKNIREIGAALGADAILEGGVQSAGNRIRINAQLIDAKTDEHLWAETYDRELTAESIFDVQDDIARAISEALHTTFSAAEQNSLIPTTNLAAYRAYHEAVTLRESRHGAISSDEYRALLQRAIDLDPTYTRPRALLIGSYALETFDGDEPEKLEKVETLLEEFRAIAPDSADFLMAQTYYTYYAVKDYDLALKIADRALEKEPSNSYLIEITSWIKRRQGDYAGQLEALYRARQLDPNSRYKNGTIINNLILTHQYDKALAELEAFGEPYIFVELEKAQLAFREHGDLDRLSAEFIALIDKYPDPNTAFARWRAHLIARDRVGTLQSLDALPDDPAASSLGISDRLSISIVTFWFFGETERLAASVAQARRTIEQLGTTEELLDTDKALTLALLAAVDGDADETQRLVEAWYRGAAQDLAGRVVHWDMACQILGIGGAADAAVDCIRRGLEIPSRVMPFLEHRLPLYDPVRDHPVFVELVAELSG
jgi:TolB-like protein